MDICLLLKVLLERGNVGKSLHRLDEEGAHLTGGRRWSSTAPWPPDQVPGVTQSGCSRSPLPAAPEHLPCPKQSRARESEMLGCSCSVSSSATSSLPSLVISPILAAFQDMLWQPLGESTLLSRREGNRASPCLPSLPLCFHPAPGPLSLDFDAGIFK